MRPFSVSRAALGVYAVLFCIAMLLPLALVVIVSLTNGGHIAFPPTQFGFKWIGRAFTDGQFRAAFRFSAELALITTVISGVIGVMGAYALERFRVPGKPFIIVLASLSLFVPHILLALGFLRMFAQLGIATAPLGLIGGDVGITLPFVLGLTLSGFKGLDSRLELASATLGATGWQTFRYVIVGAIAPSVVGALTFTFLLSFDESVLSIFLSRPGNTTLPAQIYNYSAQTSDPLIAAVSAILIALALAVIAVLDRFVGILDILAGGAATAQ
jgi:putative spermidine/putrescine transport system permease protein